MLVAQTTCAAVVDSIETIVWLCTFIESPMPLSSAGLDVTELSSSLVS
jgi:hypothetical protein